MILQNKKLDKCPLCGGTTGYTFRRVEKIAYEGKWEIYPEQYQSIDFLGIIRRTIPICIDCGKRIKYEIEYPE